MRESDKTFNLTKLCVKMNFHRKICIIRNVEIYYCVYIYIFIKALRFIKSDIFSKYYAYEFCVGWVMKVFKHS